MTQETPRIKRVKEYLYEAVEPVKPGEIAEKLGENKLNIGKDLQRLKEQGLAELVGEGQWRLTQQGREGLETGGGGATGKGGQERETGKVPSQADLLRSIGENLEIAAGAKKGGGATLDAIIYYVEHTANLDDLNSVWNRLTETGVSDPIKKRWITMYAQTLPGKKIPEELKEKIDAGLDSPLPTGEGKTEVPPKAKRFSIVAGEMMGDPEGDYTFNEAFKIWAQAKGVPTDQANPLAVALEAMIQTSKEGPQTLTAMLAAITPLITKGDTSGGNIWLQFLQTQQENSKNQMQMLQTMITSLTEEKHKAELANLGVQIEAIKTGQRAPGASEEMQTLTKRIDDLTQSLHQAQIDSVKEQSQRDKEILQGQIRSLEDRIVAVSKGTQTDGRLHLLESVVDKAGTEASGLRGDLREGIRYIIDKGGVQRPPMTSEEKTKIAAAGKRAVTDQHRVAKLASEILSS